MSFTRDKDRARAERYVLPVLRQFAAIPTKEWRYLAPRLERRTLAAGTTLTRAGEVADRLGFVVSGLIRKLHVTAHGRPVVRGFGSLCRFSSSAR